MTFTIRRSFALCMTFAFTLLFSPTVRSEMPYQLEWGHQIGTDGHDYGNGISVDSLGNLFFIMTVSGDFAGDYGGGYDIVVGKYDLDGNLDWAHQYGASSYESGSGIAVDNLGNAFVSGDLGEFLSGEPVVDGMYGFVAKYDSTGNVLWESRLAARPESVATDGLGNVYVVGDTGKSLAAPNAGRQDVFLSKFGYEGVQEWIIQIGTEVTESGWDVSADELGNVFITGTTFGSLAGESQGSADSYAIKYDSNGNQVWAKQWGSQGYDQSYVTASDGSGGAYFAGYESTYNSEGEYEGVAAFVRHLDSDGELLWTQHLRRTTQDIASSIAIDALGDVYVGGPGMNITQFDQAGTFIRTIQYGGDDGPQASELTIDSERALYVSGLTRSPFMGPHLGGGGDAFLFKITPVPEPQSALLLAIGCAVVSLSRDHKVIRLETSETS